MLTLAGGQGLGAAAPARPRMAWPHSELFMDGGLAFGRRILAHGVPLQESYTFDFPKIDLADEVPFYSLSVRIQNGRPPPQTGGPPPRQVPISPFPIPLTLFPMLHFLGSRSPALGRTSHERRCFVLIRGTSIKMEA